MTTAVRSRRRKQPELDPSVLDLGALADLLDPPTHPHVADPAGWIASSLSETTWSGQRAILESIRDNRYTAVRSAHSTGKSHIASRAAAWWVDVHDVDEVFVVTTAPTATQVKAILWRYIKAAHRIGGLSGYITESDVPEWKVDGRLVAYGRKPQDLSSPEEAASAFQGIHARYVLVILDEAGGVPEWLWNAVDTLVTSPTNRVLAIGNPDDPSSHFEKVCRPGSGWNSIKLSAFDTPAFTGEDVPQDLLDVLVGPDWVEERKQRWGEDSPLYVSKVLAEFPEVSDDMLIPVSWVREAVERDLSHEAIHERGTFGMDVARQGKDETVIYSNRGGVVRLEFARRGLGDTMKATGELMSRLEDQDMFVPAIIDADGLGAGVFDRAAEQEAPVAPFHGGQRAFKPKKFKNRRSEQWWALRELFQDGLIDLDPEDEDLQAQLTSIKWSMDSAGRVCVETKDEMKKRGLPSPDRADAVMMSTAPPTGAQTIPDSPSKKRPGSDTITGNLLTEEF